MVGLMVGLMEPCHVLSAMHSFSDTHSYIKLRHTHLLSHAVTHSLTHSPSHPLFHSPINPQGYNIHHSQTLLHTHSFLVDHRLD